MRPDRRDEATHDEGELPSPLPALNLPDEFIEIVALDRAADPQARTLVENQRREMGEAFFSNLLLALTGLRKMETDAEKCWNAIMEHKYALSQQLGRNVGIRVAAVDYLQNIAGERPDLQIVEKETFIRTARLAITDGLTGLYNHRHFQDVLQAEIARAAETDEPLSLIIFDIDYFKDYNDTNGHIAGDVALRQVAAILRDTVGGRGTPARYGGEEFSVILPRHGKKRAGAVADEVRAAIERHPFPNGFTLPFGKLTASCGVAEFPLDAVRRRGLISYADLALYKAKRDGRNRTCLFAPDRRRETRHPVRLPMRIFVPGMDTASGLRATTENLSVGGLLCLCDCMVERDATVTLTLPEVNGQMMPPLVAVALRTHQRDGHHWEVAFRFPHVNADAQERLESYLRSVVRNGNG